MFEHEQKILVIIHMDFSNHCQSLHHHAHQFPWTLSQIFCLSTDTTPFWWWWIA